MTIVTDKKVVASLLFVLLVAFIYIGYYSESGEHMQSSTEEMEAVNEVISGQVDVEINSNIEETSQREKLPTEEYFIEYCLDRDRTQSRQIELLQNIVNNPNSSATERQQAQQKILAITNTLEQELKLESIIKAKGYEDAILFIQPSSVVVIVKGHNFNSTDATIIADLVAKTTGHSLEQITIIPKV
jgi:stage III sporulation protein AH